MSSGTFSNFGGNLWFQPNVVYRPRDEAELLEVIDRCRGRRIRVVGRLHSWSEAAVGNDVVIDLRGLNDVSLEQRDGRTWVTAGGGCQIKTLQRVLGNAGAALPSLGLINEQSIAGAISTGTHGSGRESMSNFIEEVRVATYDSSGTPVIRAVQGGDTLRAARCCVGGLGVIIAVGFWARPNYRVEEHFRRYADLEPVLAREEAYPLQQYFLMPWWWQFFAQHRRETAERRSATAWLYRLYVFLQFDLGLHLLTRFVVRVLRSNSAAKLCLRWITPWMVIPNWRVVDDANRQLVMNHELFQHIECEMFVVRSRLKESLEQLTRLIKHFDGDRGALDGALRDTLGQLGLLDEVDANCGTYTHHYPICIRRVLPDDTLISMSSGKAEPSYAISLISYERRGDRAGFMAFSRVVSRLMGHLYGARPHWGKVCPISAEEAVALYPELATFRDVCRDIDPGGVFRGGWVGRVLFGVEEK
ncbi:MAG TPA: FAD-binding protein [Lacipirellulaceae bacterium]|nr:FAD-binding protein [Lacipirellulaceae bacterium]